MKTDAQNGAATLFNFWLHSSYQFWIWISELQTFAFANAFEFGPRDFDTEEILPPL